MSWAAEAVEVHRRPLLRGVSFGAAHGAITALAGGLPGAGTELFRMLAGLETPEFGAVIVLGHDISRAGARERRRLQRRLGVVFGGPDLALFASATVSENVALAIRHAGRSSRRGQQALVDDALACVGLEDAAAAFPEQLAPIERKRLAVARGLALRSPLVLADAFDDGLDAEEVAALAAVVREDRERHGGAAVLVMADAQLAARVADDVVALD